MEPVTLRSERLVLDSPRPDDRERVFEYCQDPLFERFMATPWPYVEENARFFLEELVPEGWENDHECTWAIREKPDGPLLGAIASSRITGESDVADIGYWIGLPHRGRGNMSEAVAAVLDWAFESGWADTVLWECVVGNQVSSAVARSNGFTFTGTAPALVTMRDGTNPPSWHARRTRIPAPLGPWPAASFA